ncbi:MAG: uroporphyrinogen-III C-methyltransferase [Pseudomonadota bacterium]
MKTDTIGTVYLIGAGPGAADLLTLRAARLIAEAECVFHDALVSPEILALAPQAKLIPVGKRCGKHSTAQHFINKQLIDAAQCYRSVVRLKGGDPMVFGRAQEEIDALLQANIPFQIVPGITTALAASASLGLSLTQRNIARSVAFVTPRIGDNCSDSETWLTTATAADSVVLYMASHQLAEIQKRLIHAGRLASTPTVVLSHVSYSDETRWAGTLEQLHTCPLPELSDHPMIMLMGEAFKAALAKDLPLILEQQHA